MWMVIAVLAAGMTCVAGQKTGPESSKPCEHATSQTEQSQKVLAQYPKQWSVTVPPGSKLDQIRKQMEKEAYSLPAKDLEDRSPLPAWFRVYLRKANPNLPTSGAYQYPRTATRLLQYLVHNPATAEMPKSDQQIP